MKAARVDVSALVPEAREIVARAAAVYLRHTRPWFVGLLAHGSALKGGYIAGCSDIDMQLYLTSDAFDADGQLSLSVGLAIQRELATIDPSPFGYIQCYALPDRVIPASKMVSVGPVAGGYHMLAGTLPVPEATIDDLRAASRRGLAAVRADPFGVANRLLEHGGGRLERSVRLLCTDVWPTLYNVVAHDAANPLEVWAWPKPRVMAELDPRGPLGRAIRRFYDRARFYYEVETSVDAALAVIEAGVAFLATVEQQYSGIGKG